MFTRPPRLRKGDAVAIVSPSWGGPHEYPAVYEHGLSVLREDLGLRPVEMPAAREGQSYLHQHPEARAKDVNDAFADHDANATLASIGGDDSVRILPHLDLDLILDHPKVLMGFSDTTTLLTYLCWNGMVTFYGPSVMAGISQMRNYPAQREQVKDILFRGKANYRYRPAAAYSEGYPDWSNEELVGHVGRKRRSGGWKTLQGESKASGELFGGCVEVLEMMKGTPYWPPRSFWDGKVLFLETSECMPTPDAVKYMLRNYGMQGILNDISALLMGRPRGYDRVGKRKLGAALRQVVADEFSRPDMPIIMDMDFGHTDPQMILPLGVRTEVDPAGPGLRLLEPAVERR